MWAGCVKSSSLLEIAPNAQLPLISRKPGMFCANYEEISSMTRAYLRKDLDVVNILKKCIMCLRKFISLMSSYFPICKNILFSSEPAREGGGWQ